MDSRTLRTTAADLVVAVETLEDGTHRGLAVRSLAGPDLDEVDVDFLPGQGPHLPLGEEVALFFSGAGLEAPLLTYGRVLQSRADSFRESLRFALDRKAGTAVAAALDRRVGERLPVGPGDEVTLHLRNDLGEHLDVEPVDLSETGLALRLPRQLEPGISTTRELDLLLALPGSAPLALVGIVRRRTVDGDSAVYGVEFDPSGQDADSLAERLRAWCADRV